MNASAVAPTACLQRVRTLSLRAWKLALLGVMRSLAGLPLHRSCLRKVCPKKSKPSQMGVMTVFSVDSWFVSRIFLEKVKLRLLS